MNFYRKFFYSVLTILCFIHYVPAQIIESKIDSIFEQFNHPGTPGASVMVIKDGKIAFSKGYGLASISGKVPADGNTNYLTGEITKQFTGMCIMLLKEQGKLSYSDHLGKFFPGFPAYGEKVTINNLLHHTAGLVNYKDMLPAEKAAKVSALDILDLLWKQDSTLFEPGIKRNYNNYDYAILALIIEKISGMSFEGFVKKYIFKPLQMENAAVYGANNRKIKNRAAGAVLMGDKVTDVPDAERNVLLGNDGIYLSVNDYYKWNQALYSGKMVNKETLNEAFIPGNYNNGKAIKPYYGFGWFIDLNNNKKYLYHSGTAMGYTNFVLHVPDEKLTVVVFINFDSIFGISKGVFKVVNLFAENKFAK